MHKLIVPFFAVSVVSTLVHARPKEVMCYPSGNLNEKSKSYYFSYSDNLKQKKTCALGSTDKLSPIKWQNSPCVIDESWKQFDFVVTKKDVKLTVKVFKDLLDGEHFQGAIFGKVKNQVIEQDLICDFEESDREDFED